MNQKYPVKCVFWDPERYVYVIFKKIYYSKFYLIRNSWSDEGVTTVRVGAIVECRTTHLASFTVLVDIQGSSTSTSAGLVLLYYIISMHMCHWQSHCFRLSLLLATLVVEYQYVHWFLQCLQLYIGGAYFNEE